MTPTDEARPLETWEVIAWWWAVAFALVALGHGFYSAAAGDRSLDVWIWGASYAGMAALGACADSARWWSARRSASVGVEGLRAAALAVTPGLFLGIVIANRLWWQPLMDHYLNQPSSRPAPPPPNPWAGLNHTPFPLPLAILLATFAGCFLAVFAWRLTRRPAAEL